MGFDSQPYHVVLDSVAYEKKFHGRVFYCARCSRSFSAAEAATCKFCNEPVVELHDDLLNQLVNEQKYHYYCEFCKKDFILHHKPLRCECNTVVKRLNVIGKPGISEKIQRSFPFFGKIVDKHRESRASRKTSERPHKLHEILRKRVFSQKFTRKLSSREELPSD